MTTRSPNWFDSHMHTPLCRHAEGHPREYVEMGHARGLKGVVFTCHSPMPDEWSYQVRMDPSELEDYFRLVEEGAEEAPEDFEVRLGMESDFFPGMEGWLEKLHRRADFHYILGSVHWHVPEYREAYWTGDIGAFQRQYFEHLAESAETGLFDALAHPDLVKNADPEAWDPVRLEELLIATLDRIAKTGVAMELNTSGAHKIYPEMNPGPHVLRLMREREIPVVVGSDSHTPGRVGEGFATALDRLEAAGYSEVSYFRARKRETLPISAARASLRDADLGPIVR